MTEEQRDELIIVTVEAVRALLREASCKRCRGTGAVVAPPHSLLDECPECHGETTQLTRAGYRIDDVLRRLAGRPDQ